MRLDEAVQELGRLRASMAWALPNGQRASVGDHRRFAAVRRRDAELCAVMHEHRL